MSHPTVSKENADLVDLCNRVASSGERIIVHRRGKGAALISLEDLEFFEELEDRRDGEEAERRLAKGEKPIPLEDIKDKYGVDE